jgi:lipoprotein-anchoring transpeptidase ErfK/SrfK
LLKVVVALLAVAGLACAAAPASTPTRTIPLGVQVAGIRVGGLSAEPARHKLETAYARYLRIVYQGKTNWVSPASIGARVDVDAAVTSALAATPGSRIAVPVAYSRAKAARITAALATRYDRPAVDSELTGADAQGPVYTPARAGLAVDTKAARAVIGRLVRTSSRAPFHLPTRAVPPKRTPANFGAVIVIDRASNSLRLYDGRRLVRTFSVATGQAIYPTPAGLWHIMDKQRDPWWYPPTYDEWAKGLKPVPPGPSNPLGTRWMGLNAPGVGIHGTDAPTSIGYSASHGCIRMQVPDAEWLFEHVSVGTPVVIL